MNKKNIYNKTIRKFLLDISEYKEKDVFWNKLRYKLPHKKPRNSRPISSVLCDIFRNRQIIADHAEPEELVQLNIQK